MYTYASPTIYPEFGSKEREYGEKLNESFAEGKIRVIAILPLSGIIAVASSGQLLANSLHAVQLIFLVL